MKEADFSGWASKNGLLCSDGRVIEHGAFTEQNATKVPLVWSHRHDSPENVLGHAILEDLPEGVYAHAFFNNSENGKLAKEAVQHGDVTSLSIYANGLKHRGNVVVHGAIRELSLVIAGANPGALIENVTLQHGDRLEQLDDSADFWIPGDEADLRHGDGSPIEPSEEDDDEDQEEEEEETDDDELDEIEDVVHSMTDKQEAVLHYLVGEALSHSAGNSNTNQGATVADKTIKDVYDGFTDEEKDVVNFLVGQAVEDAKNDTAAHSELQHSQEGNNVNVFDKTMGLQGAGNGVTQKKTLQHSEIRQIMQDAKRMGSLKESVLAHADAGDYGITNIEMLFPEARTVGDMPELIARQAEWVDKVLSKTKKQPFAKVKTVMADLTAEEARAKGYIKGKLKKEEVISLLKRSTGPATIYKKQKLDRDDILDITDFDVVTWLKWEIRFMLNEELARAILIGDGRPSDSDDKVKDPAGSNDGNGIRSIANDHELFAIPVNLETNVTADALIDRITRIRSQYRGSGSPTFYTTDDVLTDLLLLKDKVNRRLYETEAALATALRVSEIVAVPVMEEEEGLLGIIVNLIDYSVGTNQGGQLTFFEDFDIDFNQNKYLLETRLSGGLTKPKSALVLRRNQGTAVSATAPTFDASTNRLTIPSKQGVEYTINGETVAAGQRTITDDTEVQAHATDGYYLEAGSTRSWTYTFTAQAS